jgi:hypothetical protein
VGEGVPVEVTVAEQTISVQVRNDPASPWTQLRFHLTTASAVGNYGPTDTTKDLIVLTAQPAGTDGFTEYRGAFETKTAGEYLPALQFVWHDTDGSGPNTDHQSVIRDLEICPSAEFVYRRFIAPEVSRIVHGVHWMLTGQTLTVTSPGETVQLEVTDLRGRLIARVTGKNRIRWIAPEGSGIVVVRALAGDHRCRFVLPVVGK